MTHISTNFFIPVRTLQLYLKDTIIYLMIKYSVNLLVTRIFLILDNRNLTRLQFHSQNIFIFTDMLEINFLDMNNHLSHISRSLESNMTKTLKYAMKTS